MAFADATVSGMPWPKFATPKPVQDPLFVSLEGGEVLRDEVASSWSFNEVAFVEPPKETDMTEQVGLIGHVPDLVRQAGKGNLKAVIDLLEAGSDHNMPDDLGISALHCACKKGHIEIVSLLLSHGARVNSAVASLTGNLPIHYACKYGHAEALKILLRHGADHTKRTKDGQLPADFARKKNRQECCQILEEQDANKFIFGKWAFVPFQVVTDRLWEWMQTLAIRGKECVLRADYPDDSPLETIQWEDWHTGKPRASYIFILFGSTSKLSAVQVGWAIKTFIYGKEVKLEGLPGKLWVQPCRNEQERQIRTCASQMRSFLHKIRQNEVPEIPEFYTEYDKDVRRISGSYRYKYETVTWRNETIATMSRSEGTDGEVKLAMQWKDNDTLQKIMAPHIKNFDADTLRAAFETFKEAKKPDA